MNYSFTIGKNNSKFNDGYYTLILCLNSFLIEDVRKILIRWYYELVVPYPEYFLDDDITGITLYYISSFQTDIIQFDIENDLVFNAFDNGSYWIHKERGTISHPLYRTYNNGSLVYTIKDNIINPNISRILTIYKTKYHKNQQVIQCTLEELKTIIDGVIMLKRKNLFDDICSSHRYIAIYNLYFYKKRLYEQTLLHQSLL